MDAVQAEHPAAIDRSENQRPKRHMNGHDSDLLKIDGGIRVIAMVDGIHHWDEQHPGIRAVELFAEGRFHLRCIP